MKTFIFVTYLHLICGTVAQEQQGGFWGGFEKGYYLRSKVYGHYDFGCPDISVDLGDFQTLNAFFASI